MSTDSISAVSSAGGAGIDGSSFGRLAGAAEQQSFGAQVVTATLDRLNTDAGGTKNPDHDFQTQVLSAYTGKGGLTDMMV